MTEIYKKITVDVSRKSNVRLIFAKQNDIGSRNLLITLTDGGQKYIPEKGNSAAMNFKRGDDMRGAVVATVTDSGEILVELPQIVLTVPGETVCSISIFDGNKNKLTSSDFYLDISKEYYSGEMLEDDPNYTLLMDMFSELAKYMEIERGRITAEAKREANEAERVAAEEEREKKLEKNLGSGGNAVLFKGSWDSDFKQEAIISELNDNDLIEFYPATKVDRAVMANYRIFLEPDSVGGKCIFVADAKPTADISMKYFITKGRAV